MKHLDPRAPLVVDTRELGRRPGASQRTSRTAPAPADLGSEVVGVPQGSDLRLDLLLEAVMEGVLVTGTVTGTTTGQCVRCLDDLERPFEVRLQELYAYPSASTADDEDVLEVQGDLIDLEPALRDAVVPTLPFQPVCREDCPGLPSQYGLSDEAFEEGAPELPADVDPRWAALAQLAAAGTARGDEDETTPQTEQQNNRKG
jgi:uncharacterized protein